MPNYSHGNKGALLSAEEPPYLNVGTDVSAKYKGAFCEAKILEVSRNVKLRVVFKGSHNAYLIDDSELKPGCEVKIGSLIEAKHPDKSKSFIQATVNKIIDHSRYTVIFDDGDQCILRRNSLCLKSGKHFAESETLDQLPLTNPEHFGNPVKVGQTGNDNNSTSNPTTSNTATATSVTSATEKNNEATKETDTIERAASSSGGRGRGRKKRIDTGRDIKPVNASVQTTPSATTDKESGDTSSDSGDGDADSKKATFEPLEIGVKLKVKYGKGKLQKVYEAKVNKIETNALEKTRYFVHYTGWNNRYDEWITKSRIIEVVRDETMQKKKEVVVSSSVAAETKETKETKDVKETKETKLTKNATDETDQQPASRAASGGTIVVKEKDESQANLMHSNSGRKGVKRSSPARDRSGTLEKQISKPTDTTNSHDKTSTIVVAAADDYLKTGSKRRAKKLRDDTYKSKETEVPMANEKSAALKKELVSDIKPTNETLPSSLTDEAAPIETTPISVLKPQTATPKAQQTHHKTPQAQRKEKTTITKKIVEKQPQPQPQPQSQPEVVVELEPQPEPEPQLEPEPELEQKPNPDSEPKREQQPQPELQQDPLPQLQQDPLPQPQSPKPEPEPEPKPKLQLQLKPQPQTLQLQDVIEPSISQTSPPPQEHLTEQSTLVLSIKLQSPLSNNVSGDDKDVDLSTDKSDKTISYSEQSSINEAAALTKTREAEAVEVLVSASRKAAKRSPQAMDRSATVSDKKTTQKPQDRSEIIDTNEDAYKPVAKRRGGKKLRETNSKTVTAPQDVSVASNTITVLTTPPLANDDSLPIEETLPSPPRPSTSRTQAAQLRSQIHQQIQRRERELQSHGQASRRDGQEEDSYSVTSSASTAITLQAIQQNGSSLVPNKGNNSNHRSDLKYSDALDQKIAEIQRKMEIIRQKYLHYRNEYNKIDKKIKKKPTQEGKDGKDCKDGKDNRDVKDVAGPSPSSSSA